MKLNPGKRTVSDRSIRRGIRWVLSFGIALSLIGCGASRLLLPVDLSSYSFFEFQTRTLQAKYTDDIGFPLAGRQVRFRFSGDPRGAVLVDIVAVTDSSGIARSTLRSGHSGEFNVIVSADGAENLIFEIVVWR